MPKGPRRYIVDGQFAAVIREFMSPGTARWTAYAEHASAIT